jgi:hypothetical protein
MQQGRAYLSLETMLATRSFWTLPNFINALSRIIEPLSLKETSQGVILCHNKCVLHNQPKLISRVLYNLFHIIQSSFLHACGPYYLILFE